MTSGSTRRLARAIGRVSLLASLVGTGAYVAVYLYRWEWQRALIAGLLFLAALIIVLALAILDRLRRIESRLSGPAGAGLPAFGGPAERSDPDVSGPDFRWLDEGSQTHVFIPILLGVGVLVSGVAALVERASAFAGGAAGAPEPASARPGPRAIALMAAVALTLTAGLVLLRGSTMYEPHPPSPGTRTIVIDVADRGPGSPSPAALIAAMATYCNVTTHSGLTVERVENVSARRARLVVSPLLFRGAQRRYEGCLRDALLDRRRFVVVSVQPLPPAR